VRTQADVLQEYNLDECVNGADCPHMECVEIRRMAGRIAALEAALTAAMSEKADSMARLWQPVVLHVCGGSGELSEKARQEIDDFATYLRLKERFDIRRVLTASSAEARVMVTDEMVTKVCERMDMQHFDLVKDVIEAYLAEKL
jgi:hypothetical protein